VKGFLAEKGIDAELHIITGSVEIAPNIGLSDAVCDIVSSGSTLFKNNLKEVEVLFKSEAVLAASSTLDAEKNDILKKLQFRIQSVLKGRQSKYILMNVPNESIDKISSILPVLKSPTVLPLAEPGWSSLHSVVNEGTFWEVIDELKAAGAQDILVCPVEKMVL
jgi:ATP phosphoribosyltransferase